MTHQAVINACLKRLDGSRFNTAFQAKNQREEWLREIIGKEYANVEITPPKDVPLYNDMFMYPIANRLRLSPIYSNPIQLERLPKEPTDVAHDCYFGVLLLSGRYKLEQGGREVFLKPGEMTIYDATEPHKITIPQAFSKLLISIPRHLMDAHFYNVHQLTASKLFSQSKTNNSAHTFAAIINNLHLFNKEAFEALYQPIIEMMQSTLIESGAKQRKISSFKALSLLRVKQYISVHLDNENLDAEMIAASVRLSVRYINELFQSEHTSLMRYVTEKRLERSRQYLANAFYANASITDIALRCGFKNVSHFSRIFKQANLLSPREYRQFYLSS